MDRIWHEDNPFSLTKEEIRDIDRVLQGVCNDKGWDKSSVKVVELFGGSGKLSKYLVHHGWGEVVYCDIRKFVRHIKGVRVYHEDFETIAKTEDGSKTVFIVDPPFFKVPCWCHWDIMEHNRLFRVLEDLQGEVILLNRADLIRSGWERITLMNYRMDKQLREVGGIGIFLRKW